MVALSKPVCNSGGALLESFAGAGGSFEDDVDDDVESTLMSR
jgi:hypothetical protein